VLTKQELLKLLDDAFEEETKIVHVLLLNLSSFALPQLDDDENHTSLSIDVSNNFKECCFYFKVKPNVIVACFPQLDLAQCMQDMFALKMKFDHLQKLVFPLAKRSVMPT
jgi:hypothetical protein